MIFISTQNISMMHRLAFLTLCCVLVSSKTQQKLVSVSFNLTSRLDSYFYRDLNETFSFTNSTHNYTELLASRTASFISYSDEFSNLIGDNPQLKLLQARPVDVRFAHEGGSFIPETNEVWFTADQLPVQNTNISSVNLETNIFRLLSIEPSIPTPNGLQYFDGFVYICSQGNQTISGGIYAVDPKTLASKLIVNSWFGLRLNSPNDVTFTKKLNKRKYMWFTDPQVAYMQHFGQFPQLGNFVYRLDLVTFELRPVITDLIIPNGIGFNEDETILYVSDTAPNTMSQHTFFVYAYDLDENAVPYNRRIFSVSSTGIPDGIKVDKVGRVWTGEGDGINVRDRTGTLLGVILGRPLCKSGVISNFAIVNETVIILAQEQLWRLDLKAGCMRK